MNGQSPAAELASAVQRREAGDFAGALQGLQALLAREPTAVDALVEAGLCLAGLGLQAEALQALVHATNLAPTHVQAHYQLGVLHRKRGDRTAARASFETAVELAPGLANGWYRLGNLAFDAAEAERALACYDRALACDDRLPAFHFNRGVALKALGRELLALDAYAETLRRDPAHFEACFNRANTLASLGRVDEAVQGFDAALALRPDHAPSQFNRALALLLGGDLAAGFAAYHWRWQVNGAAPAPREFASQRWRGEGSLKGRTLLVHAEQGLGDFIQFCRYATPLRELGATVLLEAPASLAGLLESLDGPARLLPAGAPLPAFDVHCSVMDLAPALRTRIETVPATVPYLQAPPTHRARWAARLGPARGLRVGLVWRGARGHRNDAARSLALAQLAPLAALSFEFHCLQQEVRLEDEAAFAAWPGLHRHDADLADFSDTAALLGLMDLLISVDTSVAHRAGALGRPVWLLLPKVPDWRWLLDRTDSPWYPTMRIFRQAVAGDWPAVVAEVGQALRGFAGQTTPS